MFHDQIPVYSLYHPTYPLYYPPAIPMQDASSHILPSCPWRDRQLQGIISIHIYLTPNLQSYSFSLPSLQSIISCNHPPTQPSKHPLPSSPQGSSRKCKGTLMEKVASQPIFIKLNSLPLPTPMEESPNYKLSDSLPTNHSEMASSPFPAGPTPSAGHFPLHAEWMRSSWTEKAEGALEWLKNRGIKAGEPEELLSQHRSEQKKSIIQRMGRAEGKGKRGLPSLITRRLKSKASIES